jgi:hypothetical protein
MEQSQSETERIRIGAMVGRNGRRIRCTECHYLIGVCGDCNCDPAFDINDLDQRQRDCYRTRFVDLIRYFIQSGVPDLSPDGIIIYTIIYNANGLTVQLAPKYFEFMQPQAAESSNSADPEEGHNPSSVSHPNIDESSFDNSVQELKDTSTLVKKAATIQVQ